NPTSTESTLRDVTAAARAIGLQIQVRNATTIREITEAFGTFARERPDALFVAGDGFFSSRRVQLVHLTTRHAIPASYSQPELSDIGGVQSYGAQPSEAFCPGGVYVWRRPQSGKP